MLLLGIVLGFLGEALGFLGEATDFIPGSQAKLPTDGRWPPHCRRVRGPLAYMSCKLVDWPPGHTSLRLHSFRMDELGRWCKEMKLHSRNMAELLNMPGSAGHGARARRPHRRASCCS